MNCSKKRLLRNIGIGLLILMLGIFYFGCREKRTGREQFSFSSPSLSYYNDRLLFTSCRDLSGEPWECAIIEYDIQNKSSRIVKKGREYYEGAVYSWDGKRIAYTVLKAGVSCNIFVMDADGKNNEQLTFDANKDSQEISTSTGRIKKVTWNGRPSFSPDGTRIIFQRARIIRRHTVTQQPVTGCWDVFEISIPDKRIRQLTDYGFYKMSKPHFMPDGKRFIFSAKGATKNCKGYDPKTDSGNIYMMDGTNNIFRPAFVYGQAALNPSITRDGTILFTSISDKTGDPVSTKGLYLKRGSTVKEATRLHEFNSDPDSSISLDGTKILYMDYGTKEGKTIVIYFVMNTDGSALSKILLPNIDEAK